MYKRNIFGGICSPIPKVTELSKCFFSQIKIFYFFVFIARFSGLPLNIDHRNKHFNISAKLPLKHDKWNSKTFDLCHFEHMATSGFLCFTYLRYFTNWQIFVVVIIYFWILHELIKEMKYLTFKLRLITNTRNSTKSQRKTYHKY